jgi:Protein of unknown function (DUF2716)
VWEVGVEPWQEMDEAERRGAWTRFEELFAVTRDPTTGWRRVVAPPGAVTFDLGAVFSGAYPDFVASARAVDAEVLRGLVALGAGGRRLMMLDWQHPSYWFFPSRITRMQPVPPLPVFPDGDYFAYLTEDMSQGAIGHPFEQTLCVVGHDLVAALTPVLSPWLPVKDDGTTT